MKDDRASLTEKLRAAEANSKYDRRLAALAEEENAHLAELLIAAEKRNTDLIAVLNEALIWVEPSPTGIVFGDPNACAAKIRAALRDPLPLAITARSAT